MIAWVTDARDLSKEAGLLDVCDSHIGQILSFSPLSPDGLWPCAEVCEVLEMIPGQAIESGFCTGKYNQRGVVCRGRGGKQEWDLAKNYRTYLEIIRIKWPRTASVLEKIAYSYECQAIEWDKRAEREEYD